MTVQIMLTAESLLPACGWTAMHEKKGLNDSYVFSVHAWYLTQSAISNMRTMHKTTTTTKYCLNLPVITRCTGFETNTVIHSGSNTGKHCHCLMC